MPDDIVPVPPQAPAQPLVPQVQEWALDGPPETAHGKCVLVEDSYHHAIASYANEVWLRAGDGQWVAVSGHIKQQLLKWYGSEPSRTGVWQALLLHLSVDPSNRGEAVYYAREYRAKNGAEPRWHSWHGCDVGPHEVLFRRGVYDLTARNFTPYPETQITFGPLIDSEFDPAVLAACRAGDFAGAPAKFRDLVGMVEYALAHDDGTPDPATVAYFRQTVAQILRPHAGFSQFVHVLGESGARKTTILRALLSAPCSVFGLSELSEAFLADDKFSRQGLVNKIANLSNDSALSRKFVTFIKEITSGCIVTEKKFHDPAKTRLTAKLYSTMNTPQALVDDSLGIENRLIVFRFRSRDDNDRGAEGNQWMDPGYYDDQDRLWITHWLLAGLEEAGVRVPRPTPRALAWKDEVLDEAMPVRAFVRRFIEPHKSGEMIRDEAVRLAVDAGYCSASKAEEFKRTLGVFLKGRFKISDKRTRAADNTRVRVWTGVVLKEEE